MSIEENKPVNPQVPTTEEPATIDPFKLQGFMQQLKNSQNLPLGMLGGLGAAIISAVIWAAITVITGYQIGWMAIGVGFLVGLAVRTFGKGIDRIFGIVGAAWSLFGCLAGNLLTITAVIAQQEAIPFIEVFLFLATSPGAVVELMTATFSLIDLLFYGFAIYEGYKLSFRQLSKAELTGLMTEPA
jgi:hypothetical protein